MRSPRHEILDQWLRAEQADHADEADAALAALFAALPPLEPPAGFADRVLLRAGLTPAAEPAPAPWTFWASFWVRAMLTLGLLSIGVSALWLPQTLRALAGLLSVSDLVRWSIASLVGASRWLGSFAGLWEFLLTIGRALTTPLETPTVALAMASCLLVSMVAFRFLRDLITHDRSWIHVDS
jgi:hypothetical protein